MVRVLAVLAALAVGCAFMFFFTQSSSTPVNGKENEPGGFAADRAEPAGGTKILPFDGARAVGYLKAICAIGPRMSATPGMKKQQDLIVKHFEDLGVKVAKQSFDARQVSVRNPIPMTNLMVSFQPELENRVILCTHYDTRPIADQEPDPRDWREPFVSANDGGSGVAFLMEMGHHLKDLKTRVGVDLVFFDGEEFIQDPKRDEYFLGSRHFARTWARSRTRPNYQAAILLDMIAGKNASFPLEGHSFQRFPGLCNEIWGLARELECSAFRPRVGQYVLDDHLALQEVGIPAIDIIDFSYRHWHRLSDTPENCSPESLEQVAKVLGVWIQKK